MINGRVRIEVADGPDPDLSGDHEGSGTSAAAVQAGAWLASRDRPALGTHRALEIDVVLVG